MRKLFMLIFLLFIVIKPIYAAQSSIAEAEGSACMGDDKSRKQTEQAALIDAKKKAVESVSTHIKSETTVKNYELDKDLLSAFANAEVRVIKELGKTWYKDVPSGDCFKIKQRLYQVLRQMIKYPIMNFRNVVGRELRNCSMMNIQHLTIILQA